MVPATGKRLGPYVLTSRLGSGGMGEVYKAHDTRLGRDVAIKVLAANFAANEDRKARFVQEARAASALKHPNIVVIHDIATEDGVSYIVMECVDGATLDPIIPRSGMKLADALRYGAQIAEALAAAHAAGIVHRDLKPSNIILTPDGVVKLLDFGVAKLTERGITEDEVTHTFAKTAEGVVVGTTGYMSPEQAEARNVDARSDVFSFGCVFYEMLSGRKAFHRETVPATLAAILRDEPEPIEGLPREVAKLISRCLRKDPARRFQTAADLKVALQDLKEELDSGTLEIARASTPLQPASRRIPAIVASTVAAVALIALAGAWYLRRPAPAVAEMRAVPLTAYPGAERYPTFSPDGSQVAFAWNAGETQPDIYVHVTGSTANPLRLTNDVHREEAIAWSPDGRWIAFARLYTGDGQRRRKAFIVSPLGGPEKEIVDLAALGVPAISWLPDSKRLIVSDRMADKGTLALVSTEDGSKRPLFEGVSGTYYDSPSISPAGDSIAFIKVTFGTGVAEVFLGRWTADSRIADVRSRVSLPLRVPGFDIAWSASGRDLLFVLDSDGSRSHLWRVSADGNSPATAVVVDGGSVLDVDVSRNGKYLAYTSNSRETNLWRIDVATGARQMIAESTRGEESPQISTDGSKIVFLSDRSGELQLWLCDAQGANPRQLTSFQRAAVAAPIWSPDGKMIAVDVGHSQAGTQGEAQSAVYLINPTTGAARKLIEHAGHEHFIYWSRDGKWIFYHAHTPQTATWRVPASGGIPVKLTAGTFNIAAESEDGKTPYGGTGTAGIERMSLEGEQRQMVLPSAILQNGTLGGLIYTKPGDDKFYLFDIRTGVSKVLADGVRRPDGATLSPDGKTLIVGSVDRSTMDLMLVENPA